MRVPYNFRTSTAAIPVNIIDQLVSVMDTYCIYCEVKKNPEVLNIEVNSIFQKDWTISNILLNYMYWFLSLFTKFQKKKLLLAPSRPSVRLGTHGTTRLQMDRFLWNLVFEDLYKICRQHLSFSKIWQKWRLLYMNTYIHKFMITSQWVTLRARNFADKSCREYQNTHFTFSKSLPHPHPPTKKNLNVYEIMWKIMVDPDRPRMKI